MEYQRLREEKIKKIEGILREYLPKALKRQHFLLEAMEYSLMAGGKRLRPMLMEETYFLFGGGEEIIRPFMAAIEMIHTYSLVHDDLPAMDNDEYRRGKKTTHIVFGEAQAILAGDALLNYAFELLAGSLELYPEKAKRIGRAFAILSRKAGIYGMIGGQAADVMEMGKPVDKETLDFIYSLKTGALLEAAMMIGAVLAGAGGEETQKIEQAARAVGLAFQVQDDILDVTGREEIIGKSVRSDEKNQKTTYVALKGVKEASKFVEEKSKEALLLLRSLPYKNAYLDWLLQALIHRER